MNHLPAGYEHRENQDLAYVFRDGEHESLRAMGLTDRFAIEDMLSSGLRRGRGRVFVVPPPEELPGEYLVLKQVLHGGLYGRINPANFRGPERLLKELRLTAEARSRGVPAPAIAFIGWTRETPCQLYLASVRVPASRGLDEWIAREAAGAGRGAAIVAAARAVREMHDAGLIHGDLNVRNVMVADTERAPEGFVIDLYGSRLVDHPVPAARAANLARLLRSVVKDRRLAARAGTADQVRFLRAYCTGGDGELRELARRVRRHASLFPLHRLAWSLGLR